MSGILASSFSGQPASPALPLRLNLAATVRAASAPQDRAITPQDPDIAFPSARPTLSPTSEPSPADAVKATAPDNAAASLPQAPGGVSGLLARWWRRWSRGQSADTSTEPSRARLSPRPPVAGFREFTVPRRMQSGAATVLRARAFGQRALLTGAGSRRSRP